MKIILKYQEPETKIAAYHYSAVYDLMEAEEAIEELQAAQKKGYEITC